MCLFGLADILYQGVYLFAPCLWVLWTFIMYCRQILLYCSTWEIAHQELPPILCLCTFFTLLGTQYDIHLRTLNYLFPFMILTKLCWDWLTVHWSWIDHKEEEARSGEGSVMVMRQWPWCRAVRSSDSTSVIHQLHVQSVCFSLLVGKMGMINPTFQNCPHGCRWCLHIACSTNFLIDSLNFKLSVPKISLHFCEAQSDN